MSGTNFAQSLHEFICRQLDTTYTLNTFNNYCANIPLRQFGLHNFDIVQREISDMSAIVDGSYDFRVVGYFYSQ